jgi:hypothetical protein
MRKLILISVLALASATAQAGQQRGLVLASGEGQNASERIESVSPQEPKADLKAQAPAAVKETSTPVKPPSGPAKQVLTPAKKQAFAPVKTASTLANGVHARGYENQEAEARRIAAIYGVSW